MSEIDDLDRQLRRVLGEAPLNPVKNQVPTRPVAPRDPFDPGEFNRQSASPQGR